MSVLLPGGLPLADAPYNLLEAVTMALHFLRWEEIPYPEDKPPKRIWLDGEKLSAHWAMVKRRMEARAKGESRPNDPEVENDAASSLIVG